MVEQLFFPRKVERIRRSWLGTQIDRYVEWLVERRYAVDSIANRIPILIHFGEFARARGASCVQDLPMHIESFAEQRATRRHRGPRARRYAAQAARAYAEQMIRIAIPDFAGRRRRPDWPFRASAPGLLSYLQEERGLSPRTIALHGHYLRKLESYMREADVSRLADLSPALLSAFLVSVSRSVSQSSLSVCASALRTFLRFADREALVPKDLCHSVDRPRVYRLAKVPRSISWMDVRRLLDVVDRRGAVGKRDYAILLLLIAYGLRAREVAALVLDDLDWARDHLRVPHRKGGHSHVYPLSPSVGEALIQYLRDARPSSTDRHVFLQTKAPYTALTFVDVARRASVLLRRAGIAVPRPGSHTLRHTCVQRLIDGGFSLKAIGDFVGHRVPESTQIYGKVAIEALRHVAEDRGEGAL